MADPRYQRLADIIVHHSCAVGAGDKVLIEAFDMPEQFLEVLIDAIAAAGGHPLCVTKSNRVLRALYRNANPEQMRVWGSVELRQMEQMQCYVGLRGTLNSTELGDVPHERYAHYSRYVWNAVHTEMRIKKTRWVVLRWPTPSMAQQAQMSTAAFEDFYFEVCTVDYPALARSMAPLQELMERTDRVRVVGPGTDLRFSIAGIPVVGCAGERNIPDGEMFTSPVRDSVEGTLTVNTPSLNRGVVFDGIRLQFSAGRIVSAAANHTARLEQILDTDAGARYVGEFSLGFNPRIMQPMLDTLFDEKIAGSFHFTPGQAYEEADNGNRSEVHWDLVVIQRPEFGGGEIYFDDRLIRKDGQFVADELRALNP